MPQSDICQVCGASIKMMVRRGTGICSESCEKKMKENRNASE